VGSCDLHKEREARSLDCGGKRGTAVYARHRFGFYTSFEEENDRERIMAALQEAKAPSRVGPLSLALAAQSTLSLCLLL